MTREKVAIIGTAPSWMETPWDDKHLVCAGLNDAYTMGLPRADLWFDLHPPEDWWEVDKRQGVDPATIPPGKYIRPLGHRQWLERCTLPVYVHEARPVEWPTSITFPRQELEARYGRYVCSSPAWMLLFFMWQGYREIHVYGIHLSTEWEYVHQRPNLEFLLGTFLGGRWSETRQGRMRRYVGQNEHVLVLPKSSPILTGSHLYGYQHRPGAKKMPLERQLQQLSSRRIRLLGSMADAPWWKSKRAWRDEMRTLEVNRLDLQVQLERRALEERVQQTEGA